MLASVAMHPQRLPENALTLSFYAPDSTLAHRLAARLHAHAHVQWVDSNQVTPAALARAGSQAGMILLLDYSRAQASDSSALARQLLELLPDCPLVAVGSATEDQAVSVLAALRAGVQDFIDIDAPAAEIDTLLHKVLDESRRTHQALATIPARHARLILLKGVRAGIGTSTLAAHLGVLAQQRWNAGDPEGATGQQHNHVLLMDLGRPSGDLGLYLNLDTSFHYDDLLSNTHRVDATLVRSALAFDRNGMALVGQPAGTLQAPTSGYNASELVKSLRGLFDVILCDLGGLPDAHVPMPLLREADEIWLVADQAIGTLVSLDMTLQDMEKQQLRDDRLKLVIDRYDADAGIGLEQISSRFNVPLLAAIPERLQALRSSASIGQLLCEQSPRDAYVKALAPLLARLAPGTLSRTRTDPWQAIAHRLGLSRWKKK